MHTSNKLTHRLGIIATSIIALLLVTGCADEKPVKPIPQYIPVQTQKDGKWGMLAPDGKMLFANRFTSEPSLVIEGAFSVREDQSYNIYKAGATPTKINKKPLVSVGNYADGLVPVSYSGSRITLLDTDGNEKATLMPVDGHELVKSDICFHEGLLVVTTPDGKFGYVNEKGEPVIKPIYDAALPFAYGHAMVAKVSDPANPASTLSVSIIDKKGDVTLTVEPSYTVVDLDLENDRLIVNDLNGHLGFLTFDNEFQQLPAVAKNVGQSKDGVFVFSNDKGMCGVMNLKTDIILEPKYQYTEIVTADKFICSNGQEWDLTAPDGSTLVKLGQATALTYIDTYGYFAFDKVTARLLDDNGKPKGNQTFFGVGLNSAACSSVRSDWKTDDRLAGDLASIPSATGVGTIPWGTPAEQLVPAPDAASGIYAALPQLSLSGIDYILNCVGVFSGPVGATDSNPQSDEGFTFNPLAFLAGADFYLRTESEITPTLINKMTAQLQKNGFALTTAPDSKAKAAFFEMTGQQTAIIFCAPYNGHDANFFLYNTADSTLGNRWREILRKSAESGSVPNADTLFGAPGKPETAEAANYVDRTPGSRVSSRTLPAAAKHPADAEPAPAEMQ
ncbi:MAG: WG repeat-containing protein [Muribaculaceae bacterium]|nr:WG repeat-containing protein [Muribaculaceae bacterium]